MTATIASIKAQRSMAIHSTDPTYMKKYMGKNIIDEYAAFFNEYSWHNKHYAEMTFHTVFGAKMAKIIRIYMGGIYEDCRVHTHMFAPTSTGKSRAFSAAFRFAEACGLRAKSVGQITTAGMVGTIMSGDKGQPDKIRYGPIMEKAGYDIVGAEEAGIFYVKNPPEYAEDLMKMLQKSMNAVYSVENKISKDMARGTIDDYSPVSYLFATYPPATLSDVITRTGLLQRMVVLYKVYGDDIRRKIEEEMIRKFGNQNSLPDPTDILAVIARKIAVIHNWYQHKSLNYTDKKGLHYFAMDIDSSAKDYLHEFRKQVERKYQYSIGSVREEIANFRTRYLIQCTKLAAHYAMLRMSDVIQAEDVGLAQKIILPEFDNLMFFVESSLQKNEMDFKLNKMIESIRKCNAAIIKETMEKAKKEGRNVDTFTQDEKYASHYWINRSLLIGRIATECAIVRTSAEHFLSRFELKLEPGARPDDVREAIKNGPSAWYVSVDVCNTTYVRQVKLMGELPRIVPSIDDIKQMEVEVEESEEDEPDIPVSVVNDDGLEPLLDDEIDGSGFGGT